MLISIEGLDGVGKSTLTSVLSANLKCLLFLNLLNRC